MLRCGLAAVGGGTGDPLGGKGWGRRAGARERLDPRHRIFLPLQFFFCCCNYFVLHIFLVFGAEILVRWRA